MTNGRALKSTGPSTRVIQPFGGRKSSGSRRRSASAARGPDRAAHPARAHIRPRSAGRAIAGYYRKNCSPGRPQSAALPPCPPGLQRLYAQAHNIIHDARGRASQTPTIGGSFPVHQSGGRPSSATAAASARRRNGLNTACIIGNDRANSNGFPVPIMRCPVDGDGSCRKNARPRGAASDSGRARG